MTQQELNAQVAELTGESINTIARRGFVPLTTVPYDNERDREPLVVDWDELDRQRAYLRS
jgi:hypothetical protein